MGWQKYGLCVGQNPDRWETANLPSGSGNVRQNAARQLCSGCPVKTDCLEDALREIDMAKLLGTSHLEEDLISVSGQVRGGMAL